MTLTDLRDALELLGRMYVGTADEEKLLRVIRSLEREIERRKKK